MVPSAALRPTSFLSPAGSAPDGWLVHRTSESAGSEGIAAESLGTEGSFWATVISSDIHGCRVMISVRPIWLGHGIRGPPVDLWPRGDWGSPIPCNSHWSPNLLWSRLGKRGLHSTVGLFQAG